jgi:hypothetical protein
VFLSPIESTTKAEGPGPALCRAAPSVAAQTGVAFTRVSQKAPHYVFSAPYASKKWRVSRDAAEAFCGADAKCTAYCQNPAGNTLFYDRKVGDMRPRGKADAVPPGWICARAKRYDGAPPVAAALLEPPRARKASAKRAAAHKGGL